MATKKTFKPDVTEFKLTKEMVDLLSTHLSNVLNEDGTINQYMFTEDNTVGDMFEFLKKNYPIIWTEYIALWYGHQNGNTDEDYLKYLGLQLGFAIKREIMEHYRENKIVTKKKKK